MLQLGDRMWLPGPNLVTSESCSQLLAAVKADPDADMSALEAEIDQLVYSLYGLTREEIAIIEESLQERMAQRRVADDKET